MTEKSKYARSAGDQNLQLLMSLGAGFSFCFATMQCSVALVMNLNYYIKCEICPFFLVYDTEC